MKEIRLVIESANIVLKNLAQVPDSPDADKLREKAFACVREAEAWKNRPTSVEKREALMKKVLALHATLSQLGRGNP